MKIVKVIGSSKAYTHGAKGYGYNRYFVGQNME